MVELYNGHKMLCAFVCVIILLDEPVDGGVILLCPCGWTIDLLCNPLTYAAGW